ncbi:peroxisomal assembly protein [Entophlyctis luteolus]|nr:peroxisomal assembly protein [Entophlyctis luteolus]
MPVPALAELVVFVATARQLRQFEEDSVAALLCARACVLESRRAYAISADLEFFVAAARPFARGRVDSHTKVIAVVAPIPHVQPETPTNYLPNGHNHNDYDYDEALLREIEDSLFTPAIWDVSLGKTQLTCTVKTRIIDSPILHDRRVACNSESVVAVHSKAAAKIGIENGSFAILANPQTNAQRLCQIQTSDEIPSGICDISPLMFFNLGLSHDSEQCAEVFLTRISPNFESKDVPKAAQLTLARVAGPLTADKKYLDDCLDELENWFRAVNRIVATGDLICVVVNEFASKVKTEFTCCENLDIQEDIRGFDVSKNLAFFKVLEVLPEQEQSKFSSYYVTINTKIVQTGVVNSMIPRKVFSYHDIDVPYLRPSRLSESREMANLCEILKTFFHPLSKSLNLACMVLMSSPFGSNATGTIRHIVDQFVGAQVFTIDCFALELDSNATTAVVLLEASIKRAIEIAPCVMVLEDIEGLFGGGAVADKKEEDSLAQMFANLLKANRQVCADSSVAVVATTSDTDKVPKLVQECFSFDIDFPIPSDVARNAIIQNLTSRVTISADIEKKKLTTQTAGLVESDLVYLIARALSITMESVSALSRTDSQLLQRDAVDAGIVISNKDMEVALSATKKSQADTIGAPSIPNVTWDDVGGLSHVRDSINDTIQLPLERPELFAAGMKKRSGILLFGPPGTGKTLVAKAVATTFSLNFLSVKGPELLNMYIGESEANVRKIFQQARNAKPCVIFFDELDSVAPKRGDKGDSSGGVMDRIVSQLLAELDNVGSSNGGDVFVIGATNRPDLLDSALLRPGRFDKMLYLGVSADKAKQVSVMQALTRKFALAPDLDLNRVAEQLPGHLTGADLYALCSDSMLKAISRTIRTVDEKYVEYSREHADKHGKQGLSMVDFLLETEAGAANKAVVVNEEDFMSALAELQPSLTAADLAHYAELQGKFK